MPRQSGGASTPFVNQERVSTSSGSVQRTGGDGGSDKFFTLLKKQQQPSVPFYRRGATNESITTATKSVLTVQEYNQQKEKPRKKADDPEHRMQVTIVVNFDRHHPALAGLLHAIPNGAKLPYKLNSKGQRYSPEAIKLLREGLRPGIPDLFLPVARGCYNGLYVECKVLPNQPSREQLAMMEKLTQQGYCCQVIYTPEQAQVLFNHYLSLPNEDSQAARPVTQLLLPVAYRYV